MSRFQVLDSGDERWNEILRGVVSRITLTGQVKRVLVFGSFVRNEMTDNSDLDLAVVLDDSVSPREFRKNLPGSLSPWPLDLVIVGQGRFRERKDFGGVLFDAAHDGIELYPHWELN
jgi:hypothetical protein